MCLQALGLMWPALTLPFTICHIPHYRESIGTAPVLIFPSYTPTAFSALQQSLSDSPPPAHATFIFHIYTQSIYMTLLQNNVSPAVEQGNSVCLTLLIVLSLFLSIAFFSWLLVSSLLCSQNIVSHLNCLPSAPQCPIYSFFYSFSTSSNSESLGFASVSGTRTRLIACV